MGQFGKLDEVINAYCIAGQRVDVNDVITRSTGTNNVGPMLYGYMTCVILAIVFIFIKQANNALKIIKHISMMES